MLLLLHDYVSGGSSLKYYLIQIISEVHFSETAFVVPISHLLS